MCVSRVGTDGLSFAGAGSGDVAVVIVDPQGRRDTVEVTLEDKGDNTFRCTYRPVMEGPHTVHVAFAGAPITRSPFPVHVAEGECASPPRSQTQKASVLRNDEKWGTSSTGVEVGAAARAGLRNMGAARWGSEGAVFLIPPPQEGWFG